MDWRLETELCVSVAAVVDVGNDVDKWMLMLFPTLLLTAKHVPWQREGNNPRRMKREKRGYKEPFISLCQFHLSSLWELIKEKAIEGFIAACMLQCLFSCAVQSWVYCSHSRKSSKWNTRRISFWSGWQMSLVTLNTYSIFTPRMRLSYSWFVTMLLLKHGIYLK